MSTLYPPQQLHMEIDTVYHTIYGWGGTQWWPPAYAGGVNQFIYPGATPPLVGADAGSVTYSRTGGIPEILGHSAAATITTNGEIAFPIPLADPLQMDGGGTFIACVTVGTIGGIKHIMQKSSDTTVTRNGYLLFVSDDRMGLVTSDNGSTQTVAESAAVLTAAKRFLIIAELNGADAEVWYNCTSVATSSVMQTPSNVANTLTIGNDQDLDRPITGPVESCAVFPGKYLSATDRANLCTQFGIVL